MINQPISEQFRIVAKKWVDADQAASLMEETKSTVLSEMMTRILSENINIAVNKAEIAAKSSLEYKEFIQKMVELRRDANLLKVQMEYLRMRHSEEQSKEATERVERRL